MFNKEDIGEIWQKIPTYDNGVWSETTFSSREEFSLILETDYYKEPGEYEFTDIVKEWQKEGLYFTEKGYYCDAPPETKDYTDYWNKNKLRSRKGAIYIVDDKKFYLTRDYYFWINYLPIIDKVTKRPKLPNIWDTQYHIALYEFIAELKYLHAVVLKKRQFGSSFFHAAKLLNAVWFEDSYIMKMGASLDRYVTGVSGTWKMINDYRNHLNKHTAWYRNFVGGTGEWQQKIEMNEDGRKYDVGNMSILQFVSLQQNPTNGVGGLINYFFYEEAGIAPKMDDTYEFLRPAMELGDITTGQFICSGTVGDLDQCKPLKKYMYKSREHGFHTVRNKWANKKGTVLETGLFIPEQYSMHPYIDEFGNSQVQDALKALEEKFALWEKEVDGKTYQIRVSQRPRTLEEALATRDDNVFPSHIIAAHKLKIEDGDYPYGCYKINVEIDGRYTFVPSKKLPVDQFPIDKKAENKEGVLQVWEHPILKEGSKQPEWGMYYGTVDPVKKGKTTTSVSLASIYIYKRAIQITRKVNGDVQSSVEGDKIVACWTGRFDDLTKTHQQLEKIIESYNAWTLVENNVSQFVIYMIERRKQKYLIKKKDMLFLKELNSNQAVHDEYGWNNAGSFFKNHLIHFLIQFVEEELYSETDQDGNVTKVVYGITRIPDAMACEEMLQYEEGLNVDRLVTLAVLSSFIKIQFANVGYKKIVELEENKHLDMSEKMYNFNSRPFKNIGGSNKSSFLNKNRNPFKRIK